jgi:hypothetical protein
MAFTDKLIQSLNSLIGVQNTAQSKIFDASVTTLADTEGVTVDVRGLKALSIMPGAGATVTYSRVDTSGAAAHGDGQATTAAFLSLDVQWPFYRVTTAGGSCKVVRV